MPPAPPALKTEKHLGLALGPDRIPSGWKAWLKVSPAEQGCNGTISVESSRGQKCRTYSGGLRKDAKSGALFQAACVSHPRCSPTNSAHRKSKWQ